MTNPDRLRTRARLGTAGLVLAAASTTAVLGVAAAHATGVTTQSTSTGTTDGGSGQSGQSDSGGVSLSDPGSGSGGSVAGSHAS